MARLAVNALNKVLSRYSDIRTVIDAGCGDMAWMHQWLEDHPLLSYVGVDLMPYCLAINMRRFPRMHFIQTDLSNRTGVEVLPQGCDLVIAKDLLNHMVLPDAVNALSRIVATRPRFLLTHLHTNSDNTGWEKRIDKHLHYTRYDYGKPPFSLPYPATLIQRISEDACFVLYEISTDGQQSAPPRIERLTVPPLAEPLDEYTTVVDGELIEEVVVEVTSPAVLVPPVPTATADDLGPRPPERTTLTTPVTELP